MDIQFNGLFFMFVIIINLFKLVQPCSLLVSLFTKQEASLVLLFIQLQHAHKGLLRDLHIADLTHALLSFLLLL